MTTIAVIIPALNEAGAIGRLVADVLSVAHSAVSWANVEVIVADNGSNDATASEARAAGAHVVCESRRGYGYACAAGVAAANADVMVFLDGDYSYLPGELPSLLAPIRDGRADLVLGSRRLGHVAPGAMPPHQRFGNWLVAHLVNLFYGLAITDLGPYRAIRGPVLACLRMREMTFGWPTEMIVKAANQGVPIVEVPVSCHIRRTGRSKVSGTVGGTLMATWYILAVTFRYAWPRRRV
jgi:glycosyltransferase involved in cell wall biosynthesis